MMEFVVVNIIISRLQKSVLVDGLWSFVFLPDNVFVLQFLEKTNLSQGTAWHSFVIVIETNPFKSNNLICFPIFTFEYRLQVINILVVVPVNCG